MKPHRPWLILLGALAGCGGAPPPPPPPPRPAAQPIQVTPVERPAAAADDVVRATIESGLSILYFAWHDETTGHAELALGLAAGADFGKPAVAELAAELLLESSDATTGRVGLRRAIAQLGGRIEGEVGRAQTWFTVRVPHERWREALRLCAEALQAPPPGRTQLERIHRELLQRRAAAVFAAPVRSQAASMLLGFGGSGPHLEALQLRDPSEAVLFQARHYRPDRAVLALRVPGPAAAATPAVLAACSGWRPAAIAPDPLAGPHARAMPRGIHWSPGPGPCRVLLLSALPPASDPNAAALHAAWHCITLDGVGGRLERLQLDRGLGDIRWQAEPLHLGELEGVALAATATPEQALAMFALLQAARRSLLDLGITPSEQAIAAARTKLTLGRSRRDRAASLQFEAALRLAGLTAAQWQQRLDALGQPNALLGVLPDLLELPLAMVVLGGEPPPGAAEVESFPLLPPAMMGLIAAEGPRDPTLQAGPLLERAFAAVGGKARLQAMTALRCTSTTATVAAPQVEETLEWSPGGRLQLARTLLDRTIETTIDGAEQSERLGKDRVELTPLEANWRLAEVERTPTALLVAAARGDLRFRVLAERKAGDREFAVLEAVGGRFERLRIQIDTGSGLIRTVEHWTTSPNGAPTYLVETWNDYRTAGGLRLPFRRETVVDDGESRRTTTYRTYAVR